MPKETSIISNDPLYFRKFNICNPWHKKSFLCKGLSREQRFEQKIKEHSKNKDKTGKIYSHNKEHEMTDIIRTKTQK